MLVIIRKLTVILFFSAFFCLLACEKNTESTFNQVQPGMSLAQVTKILGKPTEISSIAINGLSGTSAIWRDKKSVITVEFLNDEVKIKMLTNVSGQDNNNS